MSSNKKLFQVTSVASEGEDEHVFILAHHLEEAAQIWRENFGYIDPLKSPYRGRVLRHLDKDYPEYTDAVKFWMIHPGQQTGVLGVQEGTSAGRIELVGYLPLNP